MNDEERDGAALDARAEARRAMILSRVWWAQLPLVTGLYITLSIIYTDDPLPIVMMLTYIADISIIANAVSYAGKAKSAEAKAAGYENP